MPSLTLWDILSNVELKLTKEQKLDMNRLGASLVLLSRGTPFMLAGEEMLRTKGGDGNSYKSSDEVNNLDWDALKAGSEVMATRDFYRALIEMRKENPFLRYADVATEIKDDGSMVVTYTENDAVVGIAFINPTGVDASCMLPEGDWSILVNGSKVVTGEADEVVSGEIIVPQMSIYLVRKP